MQQATAIVPQPAALLADVPGNGTEIVPQPAALLSSPEILLGIPWFHHVVLFEKIKDIPTRIWYARQTIEQGWSREVVTAQIKFEAHQREGAAITNFGDKLPAMHVQLATSRFADCSHEVAAGCSHGREPVVRSPAAFFSPEGTT